MRVSGSDYWGVFLSFDVADELSAPARFDGPERADATDVGAVSAAMPRFSGNIALKPLIISSGVYRLMWDLAKSDIGG